MWKRLLGVRDKFSHCISKVIGNGKTTSFWHDLWHPWGILDLKHHELRWKLQINNDAKVSNVLEGQSWRLPFGRGWDYQVSQFY